MLGTQIKTEDIIKKPEKSQMARDALRPIHFNAYAVCHFCNDLCAAAWFTYTVYYVLNVVKLSDTVSGFVVLSG